MKYDVILIGGGLVGASCALSLRHTNLSIAMVDARLQNQVDGRLFALHAGSSEFLKNIGVWSLLSSYASPIHQVHVSHQGCFGSVRLSREEMNMPALGQVIPAFYLEAALQEGLMTLPNFTLYRPARLKEIKQNEVATVLIETETGEKTLTASLVVGADGTESTVRHSTNIAVETKDYQQSALVTKIALKRTHHHVAYERFNDQGAIAMLPLQNNECACIITADTDTISEWMERGETDFLKQLQKDFGYRLGRFSGVGKRLTYPLHFVRAEKAVQNRVLLLGNALHTLHPIAAQGLNLALYEVALFSEAVAEACENHIAISAINLEKISERMEKQQAISLSLSHRLTQIFSRQSRFLSVLLSMGMVALDQAKPIKNTLMAHLMGKAGCVPRLLLSEMDHEKTIPTNF